MPPQRSSPPGAEQTGPSGALIALAICAGLVVAIPLVLVIGWFSSSESVDGLKMCQEFALRVNQGDPRAVELLGLRPAVPTEPVPPAAAVVLDAQFVLHLLDYKVVKVHPLSARDPAASAGVQRFVLVLKGSMNTPRLTVALPSGRRESSARTLGNPEVVVEVRDGRLYGVVARVSME